MKMNGNTMLITGGGSGIGRELARRFHDLGNTVIVAGRRRAQLEETIAERAHMHALTLDISTPQTVEAFAARLLTAFPQLNVLVNNAGIMHLEDLSTRHADTDTQAMVVTNLLGPIRLTNALVDHLQNQVDAAIVNVSSGLAFVPLPAAPTYSATKAAVHAYTVALRERLKGKVEVVEVIPPAVQTELTPGQSTREGYMPLDEYIDETMAGFQQRPTPAEILVQRVKPLRFAERQNRHGEMLEMLSGRAPSGPTLARAPAS